jgi:5-methylcytosine-specific restriction enzyme subunit McrC
LEVSYDDYTVDIAENRVLLAATQRLLRVPGIPKRTHTGLRRLLSLFADVSPLIPGHQLPHTGANRRTRRYQAALRLARLALAARSFEQSAGAVVATAFLFDLNKVFEDWLNVVLGSALSRYGGTLQLQRPIHLDLARKINMRPDMVWESHGQPLAVIDAKYKLLQSADQPHADLYQMLAYCTALDLPMGHLVYAAGTAHATRHVARQSNVSIVAWDLDLTAPVPDVLHRIERMAASIAADAGHSQRGR